MGARIEGAVEVIDNDVHVEEWAAMFVDPYVDEEFRSRRPNGAAPDNGRASWTIELSTSWGRSICCSLQTFHTPITNRLPPEPCASEPTSAIQQSKISFMTTQCDSKCSETAAGRDRLSLNRGAGTVRGRRLFDYVRDHGMSWGPGGGRLRGVLPFTRPLQGGAS